jgi:hypothetical protein
MCPVVIATLYPQRTTGTTRRPPTPNANARASPSPPAPQRPTSRTFHAVPRLPNVQDVEPAPPPVMYLYWGKAPVWGAPPTHGFRAHTVALVDNVAWIFGGCDDRGCFKDTWCFNIGACGVSHTQAEPPLNSRAAHPNEWL